ncbi:MAG: hypothetical protein IID15_02060 [Candidatus Marinimicrobia bacterium]|nr:hypothetical protein [Candidatus Neomarinimicrobiota bacterium]
MIILSVSKQVGANFEPIAAALYDYNPVSGSIRLDAQFIGDSVVIAYNHQPLWQGTHLSLEDANPPFDGIRLFVDDHLVAPSDESGWLEGKSNYTSRIRLWDQGLVSAGFPYPHSYEIRWQAELVSSGIDTAQSAPFIIYDVTDPDNITVAPYKLLSPVSNVYDINRTKIGILTVPNPVIEVENKTWEVVLKKPLSGDAIVPQPGDIYFVKINRPFDSGDTFLLTTKASTHDPNSVEDPLDQIAVIPNPYLAQSLYEPQSGFASGRGDREIHFINLPPVCTIRIYTVAGDLVTTIEHNESVWNGRESYNLLNKENMEIAFGMYIWHVDATKSNLGQKIGKFAVIK